MWCWGSRTRTEARQCLDGRLELAIDCRDISSARPRTPKIVAVGAVVAATPVVPGLVHAVRAESGNLADVEALVGADALVLEEMLVAVVVAAQVDVATVREGANRSADGLAGRGHVAHVQVDLRMGGKNELGNGQSDGTSVTHIG